MISPEKSSISSLVSELTVESEFRSILLIYSLLSISSNRHPLIHVVMYAWGIIWFLPKVSKKILMPIEPSSMYRKKRNIYLLLLSFQNQKLRKISRSLFWFLDRDRGRRSNEKSPILRRVISDMIQISGFLRYIQELSKPISFSNLVKVERRYGLSHPNFSVS